MTRHPITEQHVVLDVPGMHRVSVDRDIPFGTGTSRGLRMDIYRPAAVSGPPLPAVIIVTGYSDIGAVDAAGRRFKEWAAYKDWARLVASCGLIAVTYSNEDPVRDARAVIRHIESHADSLGIDGGRLGVWSCSGHTSTALAALQEHPGLELAVLCYGYMIDALGHDEVASAAARFGFVNATAGMAIQHLNDVPILVVRAGRDEMPGLNVSLDRFVAHALEANLPICVLNHPRGPHAFDVADDTEQTRLVIQQILDVLTLRLKVNTSTVR